MKTRVCPECGATFTTDARIQVCCSPECKRRRKLRQIKESYDRNNAKIAARRRKARLERQARKKATRAARDRDLKLRDACWEATKPVRLGELMHAKRKPANTSDVRWRIELRRRAMLKRYDCHCLDVAPDPDMLA